MGLDLLIPFGILLALVVYLIYSRTMFEKDIVSIYEEKLEEWKIHSDQSPKENDPKVLIGLLYKQNYKYELEVFDKKEMDILNISKINIKEM